MAYCVGLTTLYIKLNMDKIVILCCWLLFITNAQAQQVSNRLSDMHNSVLYQAFVQQSFQYFEDSSHPVNIHALRRTQASYIILSIGLPKFNDDVHGATIADLLRFLRGFKEYCTQNIPDVCFVSNKKELRLVREEGKIALSYALEGSRLLEGKLHYLDSLKQEGLIMLGISHWYSNGFFKAQDSLKYQYGFEVINDQTVLSAKGSQLIEKLISLGIFIDLSHAGKALFDQVYALNQGRTKLMASHSNAYEVCSVARNLRDDQLRKIAATGGLVGICLHQPLLRQDGTAGVQSVAQHIRHISNVIGTAHVCIGSDYEGNTLRPKGLESPEKLQSLAKLLAEEGFSPLQIAQIFDSNLLTIFHNRE